MDANELQEILQSDKKLTLKEVKEIIYKIKQDCLLQICEIAKKENSIVTEKVSGDSIMESINFYQRYIQAKSERQFYQGQSNAFYLCLDLLNKIGEPNE